MMEKRKTGIMNDDKSDEDEFLKLQVSALECTGESLMFDCEPPLKRLSVV